MKRVEAIIRPFKLADVRASLESLGIGGLTISEVMAAGGEPGEAPCHRGALRFGRWAPKVHVVAVVPDARISEVAEAILAGGRAGSSEDGEVVIAAVDDVRRIRTGERGLSAV